MSTVVANMLMISITLALAAILVAWAGTTYGAFSSGSGIYFVQRGQALEERFVIENVFFNTTGTNHNIMVFARNVGAEDIQIVGFYINGNSFNATSDCSPQHIACSHGRRYCMRVQCKLAFNLAFWHCIQHRCDKRSWEPGYFHCTRTVRWAP